MDTCLSHIDWANPSSDPLYRKAPISKIEEMGWWWLRTSPNQWRHLHTVGLPQVLLENVCTVFYMPGTFAPFHEGHQTMIEKAKQWHSHHRRGNCLIVLVPAHDSYARNKANMLGFSGTTRRLSLEAKVANQRQVVVDSWECQYADEQPNISLGLWHLRYSVEVLQGGSVEVIPLIGDDNHEFLPLFPNMGCLIVQRKHTLAELEARYPWLKTNNCIHFLANNPEAHQASSDMRINPRTA